MTNTNTITPLRRLRFEKGNPSQHLVARHTGIGQPRLSLLERALVHMKPEECSALATYFNVDEGLFGTPVKEGDEGRAHEPKTHPQRKT